MSFSMEVASPEQIKQAIEEEAKPVPEELKRLKETAEANAAAILSLDMESLERRRKIVGSIESFGLQTMRSSSDKNALLQISIGSLAETGDDGGQVAKGLSELHIRLKDLDPSAVDFAKSGFFGRLFNPLRSYFLKYEKADAAIADIVESLDRGKTTLHSDNTTLELEQQALRELTKKLRKEIQLGIWMDEELESELKRIGHQEEDKIRFIREEVLFPLRQRVMDLQQMLVVNQQGIMAIEVVIRNNKELIRGVERAKTVTISALNISVTVASALYNQKIVLRKIELLNRTTNDLIAGTSRMLKDQGAGIHKQSLEAGISPDPLKQAFAEVLSALDSISSYKQEALPKMRDTIMLFRELAEDGERHIQRLEKGHELGL